MNIEAYIVLDSNLAIPAKHAALFQECIRLDQTYRDGSYQYTLHKNQQLGFTLLNRDAVAVIVAEDKLK